MFSTLGQMDIRQAGQVLGTYSSSQLFYTINTAFGKLGASWVGKALWQLPGDEKMFSTLGQMDIRQVGQVLGTYSLSQVSYRSEARRVGQGASWRGKPLW